MLTFTQYLTELFNNPHSYTKKSYDEDEHEAHFSTEKGVYHAEINHYKKQAHFDFHAPNSQEQNKSKINNQEGHSAVRVFSTMHKIMKDHMEQHPHLTHVRFEASHKEPTRMKLYSHLAKHFANKHEEKGGKTSSKQFIIHRNDIKG